MRLLLTTFTGNNVLQLVIYLVIFIGIIILTYFVTKWIAGYQKTHTGGRNFEVVETMKVATGKYLQIVRVGKDEYYVIGIGKDEISFLGKLTREQIIFGESIRSRGGFSEVLASFRDNATKAPEKTAGKDKEDEDD